jgi:hypothetical protein
MIDEPLKRMRKRSEDSLMRSALSICMEDNGGGGGGGSSYIESNAHKVSNKQGVRSRNGLVVISW